MFDEQTFQSWPFVIAGALFFAAMFMLVSMMTELLLVGDFRLTEGGVTFGLAAFVGFIFVSQLVRRGG
jgi:hypothetical protein